MRKEIRFVHGYEIMTNPGSNIEIVKEYMQATGSGNIVKIMSLLADDVVWNVAGSTNVSTVGLLKGKEQVLKWIQDFPDNFKPLEIAINDYLSNETDVVALGRFRHLVKSTGRIVGSPMIIKFSIKSGKISRYQILEDSNILSKAFDSNYNWDTQKIRINGTIYEYEDRGNGEPILFAHGLFLNHTTFNEQINGLEKTFRCLSFDMPGHGGSSYRKGWTLGSLADDFALFIEENDLKPVTFVGQSFGGTVGMILAAKYPELVERLILVGTTARDEFNARRKKWSEIKHRILTASCSELEEVFKEIQDKTKTDGWLSKNQEKSETERKIMLSHKPEGLALAIDAAVLGRVDITDILSTIKCPTLVAVGTDDTGTPPELSHEIVNKISNSKLETIKNAGHHVHLEAPETLNRIIIEFMNIQTMNAQLGADK